MFRIHTHRIAATLALLSTTALPQTGFAASYLDNIKIQPKTAYTASLLDVTQADSARATRTLDWRQPNLELWFKLPQAKQASEIILTLSATPLTRVDPNTPLNIQFNNGETVPVVSNGNRFEIRLPLDARLARKQRNVLRISYPTPQGSSCVTPDHGAWSIDLAQSTLRVSGRRQAQNLSLSDISDHLEHAVLSPKKVGLIARGADAADMQALAAQAMALRTPKVPSFSVSTRGTDFNVIMVKRNRLSSVTKDPMILNSAGPRIFVPRNKPTELIFTADTDAEILDMLAVFATRKLPNARRPISSLGEMNSQKHLSDDQPTLAEKTKLSSLVALTNITQIGEQSYKFNVEDPRSTQGQLMLRVSSTHDVAEDSRLRVILNGKTLGATKLDKKRKSVAFDIKPSDLKAASNILSVSPDLSALNGSACPDISMYSPGYSIGQGSHLTVLPTLAAAPVTNLAQLATTGSLFAKSESYIALPAQTRDFEAALSVLGRMAKASGQGFVLADYTRTSNLAKDKHVLIIGPSDMVKGHMIGAPQAFREALAGQSFTGSNLLQAKVGQSASLGTDNAAVKYAAAQSASSRINRGGVAALYSAGDGRLTGVISSTPGASFRSVSQNLVKSGHWNALQGGVARWTSSSVIMVQTAQSDAGFQTEEPKSRFQFPKFTIPDFGTYDFHIPQISWPEFEIPKVSLPELNLASFKSKPSAPELQPARLPAQCYSTTSVTAKTVEWRQSVPKKVEKRVDVTPRLKSAVEAGPTQPSTTSLGLRRSYQFDDKSEQPVGSFQDVRRQSKLKWDAAQHWFKAKKEGLVKSRRLDEVAKTTNQLQDEVKPLRRTLKAAIWDKLPGKGVVQIGDRTVSVYGLILIIAFGLVLLLMSLASPSSRLGKRH